MALNLVIADEAQAMPPRPIIGTSTGRHTVPLGLFKNIDCININSYSMSPAESPCWNEKI